MSSFHDKELEELRREYKMLVVQQARKQALPARRQQDESKYCTCGARKDKNSRRCAACNMLAKPIPSQKGR